MEANRKLSAVIVLEQVGLFVICSSVDLRERRGTKWSSLMALAHASQRRLRSAGVIRAPVQPCGNVRDLQQHDDN